VKGLRPGKLAQGSANYDRGMSCCEGQRIDAPTFCRLCCRFASVRRELPFNGVDSAHPVAAGPCSKKSPSGSGQQVILRDARTNILYSFPCDVIGSGGGLIDNLYTLLTLLVSQRAIG
jgi:hypothetical protein